MGWRGALCYLKSQAHFLHDLCRKPTYTCSVGERVPKSQRDPGLKIDKNHSSGIVVRTNQTRGYLLQSPGNPSGECLMLSSWKMGGHASTLSPHRSNNVNGHQDFSRIYGAAGSAPVVVALQMKNPRLKEEEVTEITELVSTGLVLNPGLPPLR